ncbi:right-handed parallel beta-helix repeat-containing protein [Prosthecobacter debontii]|nr:right-handed parallel beta-helix repeat-containing protein [Prosthecobacter debontii]
MKFSPWIRPFFQVLLWVASAGGGIAIAETVVVKNPAELRAALSRLESGTVLKIAPGDYPGGNHVKGIENLVIEALNTEEPPHFRGGGNAWQFSRCPGLTVRNLRVSGQTNNGFNLDDGGLLDQPVAGITLEGLDVQDIGPQGNFDGIKCSGLTGLTIHRCTLQGWGGQGIDFVGCHRSVISECQFVGKDGFSASAGIQLKGGTSEVVVEKCHFKNAGQRPLNIGGSTGLAFFRPQGALHEAKSIIVRHNVIEGSPCAAAFVGVDGAEFTDNTILFPEKWIFRILQETREARFAACRNVSIKNNKIRFKRSQVATDINIGGGTAPETFRFEGNLWLATDSPHQSKPKLPVEEQSGIYGRDFF